MTNHDDEDEELKEAQDSATHWRNAFWASVRSQQIAEDRDGRGFGGDYRAVPNPQGGAQSVRPKDTTGSYDYCWCGLPEGHTWPGKQQGRRHPKNPPINTKEAMTAMPEPPRIERKHLRTYHEDLIDVIVRAVNDYGVRYRLKNNGCMLYPPDGSHPYTIFARNSDRQAREARKWFIEHVVVDDGKVALVKSVDVVQKDMDIRERTRELAEKLNSEEHEIEKETSDQRRARKARERTEAAEKMAAAQAARAEKVEVPPPPLPPGNWKPFKNLQGVVNEHFDVNDQGFIRCKLCGWTTQTAKGIGGHLLTRHDPNHMKKLWGQESRDKAIATKRASEAEKAAEKARTQIEQGLAMIAEATGVTLAGDTEPLEKQIKDLVAERKDLLAERDTLTARVAQVEQERDEAVKVRDEAQARLDLLREALRV